MRSTAKLLRAALGKDSAREIPQDAHRGLSVLLAFRRSLKDDLEPAEHRMFHQALTTRLLLEETERAVLDLLVPAGIRTVALKGAANISLYPRPELRPSTDVDLLVPASQLGQARKILEQAGWRPLLDGALAESYLLEEGTCWQAARDSGPLLELHFRLWGSVASGFEEAVLREAVERPDGALIPRPAHAVIIAAAHGCRQRPPRRAIDQMDVCLLLDQAGPEAFHDLLGETSSAGQELPVALSLALASRVLDAPWIDELAARATADLRPLERHLVRRATEHGLDSVPFSAIRLAMLCSGRPSRAGWRSLWRRLWPHPLFVETGTRTRAWPLRRFEDSTRRLGRALRLAFRQQPRA